MSRARRLSAIPFCILALAVTIASAKPGEKSRRMVVMIDYDPHGFIYTVNSEKVSDPLLALSKSEHGPDIEVILLVHEKVTLAMVNNILGILSKAGYIGPPRVFVFGSYKRSMNELNFTYSARIPFSPTGDVPPKN